MTVHFDVDTQLDFMCPAGSLYVPGAESIIQEIVRLNGKALSEGNRIVSTMDAHFEDDQEFAIWPHHCVSGSLGQRKIAGSVCANALIAPSERIEPNWRDGVQVLLEKQTVDCFTNHNLTAILQSWNADRYVVYGVVTEICVKNAVVGLLPYGRPIEIVGCAMRQLNQQMADSFLREISASGQVVLV